MGVFGVPTFRLVQGSGEGNAADPLFWGLDSLPMLRQHIAGQSLLPFSSGKTVPVGASRRRARPAAALLTHK